MTRDDFNAARHEPCRGCGAPVHLVANPNNGALAVQCTSGTCRSRFTPWGGIPINIKQTLQKRRKEYPMGESLEEVWQRFDNLCLMCGRSKEECEAQGVGRNRHHVAEYARSGHQGPIVPICGLCHPIATALQKSRALLRWSRDNAESLSDRRARVSAAGVSPDPLRAAGETPVSPLEGLSDDDAVS